MYAPILLRRYLVRRRAALAISAACVGVLATATALFVLAAAASGVAAIAATVVVALGAVLVAGVFAVQAASLRRDAALVRALGASRGGVLAIVSVLALLQTALGVLLGGFLWVPATLALYPDAIDYAAAGDPAALGSTRRVSWAFAMGACGATLSALLGSMVVAVPSVWRPLYGSLDRR